MNLKPFVEQPRQVMLKNELSTLIPPEIRDVRERMKNLLRSKGAAGMEDFRRLYTELLMWSIASGQDLGPEIQAAKELFRGKEGGGKGKSLDLLAEKMRMKLG